MSYNQYSGYGGNPYGHDDNQAAAGGGGYGASNPYGSTEQNPYGNTQNYNDTAPLAPPPIRQQHSNYSQATQESNYSNAPPPSAGNTYSNAAPPQSAGNAYGNAAPQTQSQGVPAQTGPAHGSVATMNQQGPTVLSNSDFLARVEAVKADVRTLTSYIGQIASAHQRTLTSPDSSSNAALESVVTQTQVLNTSIKDQIKFLETDAARSGRNNMKDSQSGQLKTSFKKQLEEYRAEEATYERRYREQIARQYRIVNPEATEAEVQDAANADWGNEGVFQTALKTNRTATASTVLGAVRARHNDIQQIERTLIELNKLFEDLAEAVIIQEPMIQQAEVHTENVKKDTEAGNVQLDKGISSARRARRMKWWCFWAIVIICCIIALVLGIYFGVVVPKRNNNNAA